MRLTFKGKTKAWPEMMGTVARSHTSIMSISSIWNTPSPHTGPGALGNWPQKTERPETPTGAPGF